jgi:hypothetical protein
MASSLRDKLEDFVYETEWAMKAYEGDAHTKMIVASMVPGLVAQMPHMDLSDCPTYKGKRLMLLGKHPAARSIDRIDCDRMVYLGEDGKFYVQGLKQRRLMADVIDIHPYGINDAKGWDGIRLARIADMLATYYI